MFVGIYFSSFIIIFLNWQSSDILIFYFFVENFVLKKKERIKVKYGISSFHKDHPHFKFIYLMGMVSYEQLS